MYRTPAARSNDWIYVTRRPVASAWNQHAQYLAVPGNTQAVCDSTCTMQYLDVRKGGILWQQLPGGTDVHRRCVSCSVRAVPGSIVYDPTELRSSYDREFAQSKQSKHIGELLLLLNR